MNTQGRDDERVVDLSMDQFEHVDARDRFGRWCEAEVRKLRVKIRNGEPAAIWVHWAGFDAKYDCWIDLVDSDGAPVQFAPSGTLSGSSSVRAGDLSSSQRIAGGGMESNRWRPNDTSAASRVLGNEKVWRGDMHADEDESGVLRRMELGAKVMVLSPRTNTWQEGEVTRVDGRQVRVNVKQGVDNSFVYWFHIGLNEIRPLAAAN